MAFQVVLILALLEMFCSAESSTKTLPMDLLDATLTDDELVAVLGNDVDMEREVDVSLPSSLAVLALDKNVSLMLTDANYLHIASAAGRDTFVTHCTFPVFQLCCMDRNGRPFVQCYSMEGT